MIIKESRSRNDHVGRSVDGHHGTVGPYTFEYYPTFFAEVTLPRASKSRCADIFKRKAICKYPHIEGQKGCILTLRSWQLYFRAVDAFSCGHNRGESVG